METRKKLMLLLAAALLLVQLPLSIQPASAADVAQTLDSLEVGGST